MSSTQLTRGARVADPAAMSGRPRAATGGNARARGGLAVLGWFLALLFVIPLWWTVASALRPQQETFATISPVSLWTLVPRDFTLDNFARLFDTGFGRAMTNSSVVTVGTLVGGLAICAMAAFALAVLRFPGRGVVFAVMVVSFLIPFDAIAIPLMSVFRGVQLDNSYLALILPGIGNGFAVFLLRGFFLGVPVELADAARVDGLGWWGVFRRIYLPLSKPALIGAGLILFVFQWQAYLWPLLIAPDPEMKVAPVAIAQFAGQQGVDFGAIFAGATMTAVVPLLVLLFFQRYFTQSVSSSGVKG
jgi:multiple sugar transport system permease protein/putative chitobiose transport system permease protein